MLEVYTDGASRGNPGESAISCVFVQDGHIICVTGTYIGYSTNNLAEYSAILKALREAERYQFTEISIISDNELAIKQINGKYKVKVGHLVSIHNEVIEISKTFKSVSFKNVSRENKFIRVADRLCNAILDSY